MIPVTVLVLCRGFRRTSVFSQSAGSINRRRSSLQVFINAQLLLWVELLADYSLACWSRGSWRSVRKAAGGRRGREGVGDGEKRCVYHQYATHQRRRDDQNGLKS